MRSAFFNYSSASLSGNLTRYLAINGGLQTLESTNAIRSRQIIASDGDIDNARVEVSTAPGTGETCTFTLQVNDIDTALVATVSGTGTTAVDTSNSVAVSAGDTVRWKVVTSSGSAAVGVVRATAQYSGDTTNESLLLGTGSANPSGTKEWQVGGASGGSATVADVQQLCPTAGTIKKLYIASTANLAGGSSVTFEVYKNGSGTGVTATIAASSSSASDLSNTVAVAAGDLLSLHMTITGTPDGAGTMRFYWGMVFLADNDDEFPLIAGGSSEAPENASTDYGSMLTTFAENYFTDNTYRLMLAQTFWLTKIQVKYSTAPGAGKTRTLKLQQDQSASLLSVTVSDTDTAGSADVTVAVTADEQLNMALIPTGTPSTTQEVYFGMIGTFVEPAVAFIPKVIMF